MAFWGLDIASETVFVGDAGLTAPNRPSRRTGIELSSELRPLRGVRMDADLAYSRARFRDRDPAGDRIPGAVEGVASAGIEYEHPAGEFAALRLRYFGPRPLIEDNMVRSHASTILNAAAGYRAHRSWTIELQAFNLLDARVSDIDYYYTSRLPGEPAAGIDDLHTHPQEPFSIRLVLSTGVTR
jgi:outer membrane receptor protein involved in Fe transport